jgi:hypothetical protein
MKLNKLTILGITLLATMLLGAGAVLLQSQSQEALPINVVFDPKTYAWDTTVPQPWNAEIWRQKVKERADPTTIRLEDIYKPTGTTPAIHGPRLIVHFDGNDVRAAIWPKLPTTHMGILIPGTYRVKLKVSGNLLPEFGVTPFEGYGTITVTVPELPPPP